MSTSSSRSSWDVPPEDAESIAFEETADLWIDFESWTHDSFVRRSAASFSLEIDAHELDLRQQAHKMDKKGCTGTAVWAGGIVLAMFLDRHAARIGLHARSPPALRLARAVELGSGTGLVGLAAARLGADVCMTDQEDLLVLMRRNAAANKDALRGNVVCQRLDWTEPRPAVPPHDMAALAAAPDAILASDVVYNPGLVPHLVRTIAALATPPHRPDLWASSVKALEGEPLLALPPDVPQEDEDGRKTDEAYARLLKTMDGGMRRAIGHMDVKQAVDAEEAFTDELDETDLSTLDLPSGIDRTDEAACRAYLLRKWRLGTVVFIAHELRTHEVHETFVKEALLAGLCLSRVPVAQQHEEYREGCVVLYRMWRTVAT